MNKIVHKSLWCEHSSFRDRKETEDQDLDDELEKFAVKTEELTELFAGFKVDEFEKQEEEKPESSDSQTMGNPESMTCQYPECNYGPDEGPFETPKLRELSERLAVLRLHVDMVHLNHPSEFRRSETNMKQKSI